MINGARKQRVVSLESSTDYIKSAISSLVYVCVICVCILHCHLCQRFRILIGNYRLGTFYFCLTWKNTNFICVAASPFPPPTSLPFASSFHCRCCLALALLAVGYQRCRCSGSAAATTTECQELIGVQHLHTLHMCVCVCVCV